MTRKRWLAVIGAIGTVVGATGCRNNAVQDNSVRDYLSKTGKLYKWEVQVGQAVCQLERQAKGLDPNYRLCPEGTPPVDLPPPPSYGK